jgi:hypothetical protein
MIAATKTANIAMLKSGQTMQLRAAVFQGIVDANKAIVGMSYVAAYVALDWVSFIEPYASFNIATWNPNTCLSFIYGGCRELLFESDSKVTK